MSRRLAFYDFDGTLASTNVVTQYAFQIRHHPNRAFAALKTAKLIASIPLLLGLDLYSRRLFNTFFFREYRGLSRDWLGSLSDRLFDEVIRPGIFPGAESLLEADRDAGFETVLVTGSLDVAVGPVVRHFGFDELICNSLVCHQGRFSGAVAPPLIAEQLKVEAMYDVARRRRADLGRCKAYSDSMSDLPMLEAVGLPAAVNPGRRLRKIAAARGWPVLDLRKAARALAIPGK
jgi:HAD superfamily hydrolase (TIGR01490 family)